MPGIVAIRHIIIRSSCLCTLGIFAPSSSNFSGFRRNLTNSIISCLASSQPATSLNITFFGSLGSNLVTDALPTLKMFRPWRPMPSMPRRDKYSTPASERRRGVVRVVRASDTSACSMDWCALPAPMSRIGRKR
eukprot:scaffold2119_cov355-Prasinococcus_capsulatus_cf.AAC.9